MNVDGRDVVGDGSKYAALFRWGFSVSAIEGFQRACEIAIMLADVGGNQQTGNIEGLQV